MYLKSADFFGGLFILSLLKVILNLTAKDTKDFIEFI